MDGEIEREKERKRFRKRKKERAKKPFFEKFGVFFGTKSTLTRIKQTQKG